MTKPTAWAIIYIYNMGETMKQLTKSTKDRGTLQDVIDRSYEGSLTVSSQDVKKLIDKIDETLIRVDRIERLLEQAIKNTVKW